MIFGHFGQLRRGRGHRNSNTRVGDLLDTYVIFICDQWQVASLMSSCSIFDETEPYFHHTFSYWLWHFQQVLSCNLHVSPDIYHALCKIAGVIHINLHIGCSYPHLWSLNEQNKRDKVMFLTLVLLESKIHCTMYQVQKKCMLWSKLNINSVPLLESSKGFLNSFQGRFAQSILSAPTGCRWDWDYAQDVLTRNQKNIRRFKLFECCFWSLWAHELYLEVTLFLFNH